MKQTKFDEPIDSRETAIGGVASETGAAERRTGERREEKKSVMIYVAPIKSVKIFRFQLSTQQFR